MNYTQEHRIALLEAYLTNTSCQYCGQQCQQKFPDVSVPGKQTSVIYQFTASLKDDKEIRCPQQNSGTGFTSTETMGLL